MKSDVLIVIPARYGSTRFPGKPLAMLGGRTVISRVCEVAASSGYPFIVATDHEEIAREVRGHGWEALMTSENLSSGTERVAEALTKINGAPSVIVNIQGDEPFVTATQIQQVVDLCQESECGIATLVKKAGKDSSIEEIENPNVVKVELTRDGIATAFSRSVIPFLRNVCREEWPRKYEYLLHVGLYAFRKETLEQLVALPPSPLEKAESLEQLRWIEWGWRIKAGLTETSGIGIDTPEDLREAEKWLRNKNEFGKRGEDEE